MSFNNNKKSNDPPETCAEDFNRHFPKDNKVQQVFKKMLNTANHQENANQNYKILSWTCLLIMIKKTENNKYWQE